jgi:hypothetical protein
MTKRGKQKSTSDRAAAAAPPNATTTERPLSAPPSSAAAGAAAGAPSGEALAERLRAMGLAGLGSSGAGEERAQVIPLGYVNGFLWRLVLLPPPPGAAKADPVPQLQHQHTDSPEWELVAHDDLLSHLTFQAYRRGSAVAHERREHGGLVVPGHQE